MNESDSTFPGLEEPSPADERQPLLPQATWGIRDIVIGIFGALILFFLLGLIVIGAASAAFEEDSLEMALADTVAIAFLINLVIIGTVLVVVERTGSGLPELGFRQPARGWLRMLGYIGLGYLSSLIMLQVYLAVIGVLDLDLLEPPEQLSDDFYDYDVVVGLTGVAIIFLTPVAEEIFFRGFIFGGLRRYLSFPVAALISGTLFAMAHGDPGFIVPFAGVGFILAYLYERSGSLYTPIGMHFVFNSVSFMLALLFPELR